MRGRRLRSAGPGRSGCGAGPATQPSMPRSAAHPHPHRSGSTMTQRDRVVRLARRGERSVVDR
jgi:hypothetical protein